MSDTYLGQVNWLFELLRPPPLADELLVFVFELDVLIKLGSSKEGRTHFKLITKTVNLLIDNN